MRKTKDIQMTDTTFQKMVERLRQSAKELENMSSLDINDEIIQYEYQIKFNEINKIVGILYTMLDYNVSNSKKEKESVHLLNE